MSAILNGYAPPISFSAGRSWQRPDPVAAGGGSRWMESDSLVGYTSSGLAAPGWAVELGGASYGSDRAGLQINSGTVVATGLDFSSYTTGNTTLAVLFDWDGPSGTYSAIGCLGDATTGTSGLQVYFKPNGANLDLIAITGSGGGQTVLTSFAPASALAVGLHAVSIAPVVVGGVHKWRWSFDGSSAADTAMTANYVAPTSSTALGFGCRADGNFPLIGKAVDMILWGSLLGSGDLAALTTLPSTPTYLLPESASTGAGAIRVQANRFNPELPLVLLARGLPVPLSVSSSVRKVQY